MKNLHFLKLMIIPMFILFQTACVANDGKRETIERNYSVSAFNAIKSEVVGNIEVVQTSGNTVSVIGDKELVENLTVKVEDDKLKLSMKKELRNFKWKGKSSKLTIYVSAPDLVLIESEGVGNIRLNGDIAVASIKIDSEGVGNISSQNLTAEHVEIDSEGVGNITLKGSTSNLVIKSDGVGNIKTDEMTAQHAKVKSDGIGNVSCHASESIDIETDGIGNVSYYGNPKTKNIRKDGIGKVRAK